MQQPPHSQRRWGAERRYLVLQLEDETDAGGTLSNVVAVACGALEVDYTETVLHHVTGRDRKSRHYQGVEGR